MCIQLTHRYVGLQKQYILALQLHTKDHVAALFKYKDPNNECNKPPFTVTRSASHFNVNEQECLN